MSIELLHDTHNMPTVSKGPLSDAAKDAAHRHIETRLQGGRTADKDLLLAEIAGLLKKSPDVAQRILCDFLFSRSGESEIHIYGKQIEMHQSGIVAKWEGTPVGERLGHSVQLKKTVARKVVQILAAKRVSSVLLSSGTTAYYVLCSLLDPPHMEGLKIVYSNNLLILDYFLEHQPPNVKLHLLAGRIDKKTAALEGDFDAGTRDTPFRAAVVGFTGLSMSGLHVNEHWEVRYLPQLIRCGQPSEIVVIPMTLDKIGSRACDGAHPVEGDAIEGGWPQKGRRVGAKCQHILVTNKPEGDDPERDEILQHWHEHVGEVVYAE